MRHKNTPRSLFDPAIIKRALTDAVLFVVEVGSVLTTFYWIRERATHAGNPWRRRGA